MLKQVKLRNFRSVENATIDLSESKLTVLVGANACGKTNVVKALEFISALSTQGLESAIIGQGGQDGLLPKSIPAKKLNESTTMVEYTCELSCPRNYPEQFPLPSVTHRIEIGWKSRTSFKVKAESIAFTQVATVGKCSRAREEQRTPGKNRDDVPKLSRDECYESVLNFKKGSRGALLVDLSPKLEPDEVDDWLAWFRMLPMTREFKIRTHLTLVRFLKNVYSQMRRTTREKWKGEKNTCFVESQYRYPFDFSQHKSIFRRRMGEIMRYDLQLEKLRTEHAGTSRRTLESDGKNLPSAYRILRKESVQTMGRLMDTLRVIAPQVAGGKVIHFRGGKELLEFLESATGRPVESWEASDGTLRAMGILLAVATQEDGMIIIEEPERCLHPWAVRALVSYIREEIKNSNREVVITTHSQQVLECIEPEELRIIERQSRGGTQVKTLDDIPGMGSLDMGEVGRMWVSGLLGGVPNYE